jgi:hypothetical protein
VIDGGQSNDVGAGALIAAVPLDYNRHGDKILVWNSAGQIAPSTESLSLNIDWYVTANPTFGLGAMKTASNDYLDAYPDARILHVPCGFSASGLDVEWAIPNGPETVRMIARVNAAVAATGCMNAVLMWYQGENHPTPPSSWGAKTQALWNYIQAETGVTFSLILYCQLAATPWPPAAAGWEDVRISQATIQTPTQIMIVPPDCGPQVHQDATQQQTIGHAYGALLVSGWPP